MTHLKGEIAYTEERISTVSRMANEAFASGNTEMGRIWNKEVKQWKKFLSKLEKREKNEK